MKINSYTIAALPKLDDRLIGTSVNGTPADGTYNFTPQELLELYEANFNAPDITITNTPVYADNATALAGGLVAGQIYRTADFLKIVH
jgi:hypothetical protein